MVLRIWLIILVLRVSERWKRLREVAKVVVVPEEAVLPKVAVVRTLLPEVGVGGGGGEGGWPEVCFFREKKREF